MISNYNVNVSFKKKSDKKGVFKVMPFSPIYNDLFPFSWILAL